MATILVVEDQAETRRPLAKLLKLAGYDVLTAADAYAAAATIRNQNIDLMLLDVGIPPMDGLTMLMLLRQEHRLEHIPVILVTGHSDENTAARATELGVKAYLIKAQFTPEELLDVIRQNLEKSH